MAAELLDCILCSQACPDTKKSLFVRRCYICPECEARIISISVNDPCYMIYITRLKKIWSQAG